jgi:3-deoxy-D-manno-octulosonate 8-phosphate phosphatase (KDO 8-P phosphatase)
MSVLKQFKQIRTFVLDVDGVLTDGTIQVFDSGEQVRTMNIKDGYALQLAVKKGYRVVIISGGGAEGVRSRLEKLGISDVFLKVENKKEKLLQYVREHGLLENEILYMGNQAYCSLYFCLHRRPGLRAGCNRKSIEA